MIHTLFSPAFDRAAPPREDYERRLLRVYEAAFPPPPGADVLDVSLKSAKSAGRAGDPEAGAGNPAGASYVPQGRKCVILSG